MWTPVTLDKKYCFFRDVTYYQGNFYAVHNNGYVVVVRGLETPEFLPCTKRIISESPGKVANRAQQAIKEKPTELIGMGLKKVKLQGESILVPIVDRNTWPQWSMAVTQNAFQCFMLIMYAKL
ncbi:hypothetical protein IFM89_010846 [Coptis chinensis]|uniref:Uncharacterized protein n=1 Tax=Coptis chinensis TaxID=261450 RepID=A0A835I134_9MAGN|nr:hypothetical protein IFM89_010846 [Coptis chinensis]